MVQGDGEYMVFEGDATTTTDADESTTQSTTAQSTDEEGQGGISGWLDNVFDFFTGGGDNADSTPGSVEATTDSSPTPGSEAISDSSSQEFAEARATGGASASVMKSTVLFPYLAAGGALFMMW